MHSLFIKMAAKISEVGLREVVVNIKQFFEREKAEGHSIFPNNIMARLEVATGIPNRTIHILLGPSKAGQGKRGAKKIEVDDFDRQAIMRKVHEFYQRKEFSTLEKLLEILRTDISFTGGRTTLWRILRELGFKFKKQDGRKFLVEKPEIVMLRHQYLRKIRKLRASKPPCKFIYLDETWINANHTVKKCWVDKDGKGGIACPLGKGQRLIIVHAGSSTGFVPNAKLSFVSKTNSSDYHDEMNAKHFEEWIEQKVFPNIPAGSTIVMDNASYHSVRAEKLPTSNSRKAEMQDWLRHKNVAFSSSLKKADLYDLIKLHKPHSTKYKIDELAKKYGHDILRLPPYHCDFNPT